MAARQTLSPAAPLGTLPQTVRTPQGGESLWTTLRLAWRTAATRRHLARLDDRALKDIGLSRAEALAEAERAPWDLGPPPRRRR